jgi:tetratricopeptide (TPR) repeat protein
MDAITIGAVLLAILTGAGSQLGTQLWTGIGELLRRPFHGESHSENEVHQAGQDRTGLSELLALERAPDENRVLQLAQILIERAGSDEEFGRALESWWERTGPARGQEGASVNTINLAHNYGAILQGDFRAAKVDVTVRAQVSAPVALAQLPPPIAGFSGRDAELETVTAQLRPTRPAGTVVISAVAGLAGVGKTALAIQAGHIAMRRGWCAGGQLLINLHGYDETQVEPNQALEALLRALGVVEENIPPSFEARASLYRSTLALITEPILIIADNASSEAQVRPLLPGTGPHRLIATSRHTLADLGARIIDVTVLDDNAGAALLGASLRIARPGDARIATNNEAARRLASMCGGLPLALQIAAALLKSDPDFSVAELADALAAERVRIQRLRYDDGGGQTTPSVEAAFELSYKRLDPTAARIFRLLPVNPGSDVSTDAVGALAEFPFTELRSVLSGLARAHLIEGAPGEHGRWRMHDLVRLYAQQLSEQHARTDRREEATIRLLNYYTETVQAAAGYLQLRPVSVISGAFANREAATTWLDAERQCLVAAVTMASVGGRNQVAFDLSMALWPYLDWRRRFDDLMSTATASLDAARRVGDHSNEGRAMNTLGIALWRKRRLGEAINACRSAAVIFRESGERHWEGRAQTNLGIALREANRLDEAVAAHQNAAAIFRQAGDRRYEAVALTNMGSALRKAGRSADAVRACRSAAVIFHDLGDSPDEGAILGSLGRALVEMRNFDDAITAHANAVSIFRDLDDSFSAARAHADQGVAFQHAGLIDNAVQALQEAAAVFQNAGDRHFEGIVCSQLGSALQCGGGLRKRSGSKPGCR